MNTIIAYAGEQLCAELLIQGLNSAPAAPLVGIAVKAGETLEAVRTTQRPETISARMSEDVRAACIGIGGTAEALFPAYDESDAPPKMYGRLALAADGPVPLPHGANGEAASRQTGEAALLHLFASQGSDTLHALREAAARYPVRSFAVLNGEDGAVYLHAGRRPLYVGIASHGVMVAGEYAALLGIAVRFYVLRTGELAKLTQERITVYDKRLRRIRKSPMPLQTANVSPTLPTAPDDPLGFLLTVKATLSHLLTDGSINGETLCLTRRSTQRIEKILLAASGDEWHAARQAAYHLMLLTDIPAKAYPAGELRYSGEPMDKGTLLITVDAYGRNEDLLVCLKRASRLGARTMLLTACPKSPPALTADETVLLQGTNAYAAASLTLAMMSLYLGSRSDIITDVYLNVTLRLADMLSGKVSAAIKGTPTVRSIVQALGSHPAVVTAGIGADEAVAGEAAAILRRHMERPVWQMPLSELAAYGENFPSGALLLCFLTEKETAPQAEYLLRRLFAAGRDMLIITTEGIEAELFSELPAVALPDSVPLFAPLVCMAGLSKACANLKEALSQAAG